MKKRIISILSCFALVLSFAMTFVGCGPATPPTDPPPPAGHTCDFNTSWSYDEEFHWKKCKQCDEITDKERHDTSNICTTCYYGLPDDQSLMYHFSGHSAYLYESSVHTRISKATGLNEYKTTWYDLAENQISVVAQDILHRLTFVYGTERANTKHELDNSYNSYKFAITDRDRVGITGHNAYVLPHLILSEQQEETTTEHENCFDLNCLICLQDEIKNFGTDSTNYLYNASNLNLAEAISGKYTTTTGANLDSTQVISNTWNWYNSSLTDLNYETYANAYLNNFKMALAEIVSEKQTITATYNEDAYNDIINKLVTFNLKDYKTQIIDFVKNSVIGTALIAKDNIIKEGEYFDSCDFVLDANFTTANLPQENNPKTYKAYDYVVENLINQTFENKYRDSAGENPIDAQKLAYKITKLSNEHGSNYVPNQEVEKVYATMLLHPKANTPTTLRSIIKSSTTNPNKTLNIDFIVVLDGTEYKTTKTVTLTAEEQYLDFNIAELINGLSLKQFNRQNNYIKLDFHNENCIAFNISFLRMMPAE